MGNNITQNPYLYGNRYQNVNNNITVLTRQSVSTIPNFKGQSTTTSDTVTFNTSQKQTKNKKSMSTGAQLGIGLGTLLALGGTIWAISHGKSGTKEVQQFAEHVEFKPAETIEEAKKFAKDKLGVHYHDIDDLEAINFYNKWITGLHNECKVIDKSSYPKFIANYDKASNDILACLFDTPYKEGKHEGYVMGINMRIMKDFSSFIESWLHEGSVISKNNAGAYTIKKKSYDTEFTRDLIKRLNDFNPNKTTYEEKNRIILDILGLEDGSMMNGKIQEVKYGDFYYLNHELGHLRHHECIDNYSEMKKVEEFKKIGQPVSNITNEFINNDQIQQTARQVSVCATESPLEFVADVFAGYKDGRKFSDDVMALYKKYNGPNIS